MNASTKTRAAASAAEAAPVQCDGKFNVRDLNLFYGDFHALKDVNLDISSREVLALIGPSGCGKSTFIRTLNRMNDLVEGCRITGSISLDGRDVYAEKDASELRSRVGMVFQKPNPFPMSIFDNIAYGPRMQGLRDRKAIAELVETSLVKAALWDEVEDRLKKSALSLSGGQQQRLCIARAIAMSPEVILMDEPTSALDPIATKKIEELVEVLKKDYTIVIVTHSMNQAARISDKVAFFLLGEIVEQGTTIQIFNSPVRTETAEYIGGRFG